jgi:hypothetical protein
MHVSTRFNDDRAEEILNRIKALPNEALALALQNIQRGKLSPEENRRRRARKATVLPATPDPGFGGPESQEGRPRLRGRPSEASNPRFCGAAKNGARTAEVGRRCPTVPKRLGQSRKKRGKEQRTKCLAP